MKHFLSMLLVAAAATGVSLRADALPPDADGASTALKDSPRHGEYINLPLADGTTKLKTWIAYPEVSEKAPVIIVIHEIFGFTEWVQSVADAFAADGFIAIAPDLISGMEGAEDNPRETIGNLTAEEAVARLDVVFDYAKSLPASSGAIGCVGYCWGGKTSFLYATAQPELKAAVVYYGTPPDADAMTKITAPVLGLYGGNDARVTSTVEQAKADMAAAGKTYEVEIYEGAGHGFLRQQSGQDGANMNATTQAWPRTVSFFREYLK